MVLDAVHRLDDATVAHCLRGAFDLNCKCAPTMAGYALDHAEAAEEALALGMGGLVFRDDGYCTTPIASLLAETSFHGEPISITGSVTLNNVSGGLNFYAAEHALALGGRVVSMPTVSAQNHLRAAHWPAFHAAETMPGPRALTAVDDGGAIRHEAIEVLEIIAERDGVLDAGALHVSEALALFREAERRGVKRLLLSDPARRNAAQAADLDEAIDLGAAVEFLPQAERTVIMVELVARRAPDRLILGLDTGPCDKRLSLRERYAQAARFWSALGLSPPTIAACMSSNVQQLAGLPANGARRAGDLA